MKKTIIYLHGFGSTGDSEKTNQIKNSLKKDFKVISPTLSPNPSEAIIQIRQLLSNRSLYMIAGTSLGGFYADYFNKVADIPAVLINPVVDVEDIKQFIGNHVNYSTGKEFNFSEKDYKDIVYLAKQKNGIKKSEAPEIIILAKDDEILDYKKSMMYFSNDNQYISLFSAGGHRFDIVNIICNSLRKLDEFISNYDFYQIFNESFETYRAKFVNERYINSTDKEDKLKYWNDVKHMIDLSYSYIRGFEGDINKFLRDEYLWKLVRKNSEIVAGGIYKMLNGRKGVCMFTNGTPVGKESLKKIIKEDIKMERAWVEVSGKVESLYKNEGSTPIPHEMVKMIMNSLGKKVIDWDGDGYHYIRLINNKPIMKAMYGSIIT
jgi:uncharacterized protein